MSEPIIIEESYHELFIIEESFYEPIIIEESFFSGAKIFNKGSI